MKARYFSEPCPACERVEREFLPTLKMHFKIERYDLRFDKNTTEVKIWNNYTGKIPAIQITSGSEVEWYIGAKAIGRLTKKCEGETP